jgi:hypothetical protein
VLRIEIIKDDVRKKSRNLILLNKLSIKILPKLGTGGSRL